MTVKMTPEDLLWALAVKERDRWRCRKCGKEPAARGLHAHHIFGRGRKSTRLDVENGVALCMGHHVPWAHAQPLEFHEWAREQLGAEAYDALRAKSQKLTK